MNNNDSNELENWLINKKLDWWGKLIENNDNYTSDYDMLVWELEKKRNEINKIF